MGVALSFSVSPALQACFYVLVLVVVLTGRPVLVRVRVALPGCVTGLVLPAWAPGVGRYGAAQ